MKSIIIRLKKSWLLTLIGLIVLGGGAAYAFFGRNAGEPTEQISVARGSISEEVIVTGKTKPHESVNLAFEKIGKISRTFIDVGDAVVKGQVLAELDKNELLSSLSEAEAQEDAAKAELAELKQGTRPEEIKIQEVKVLNAKTSLEDAKQNLVDKILDAHTKADDALHNAVDQLYSNPRSQNPQISITGFYQKQDLENRRFLAEQLFVQWTASISSLSLASDLSMRASESQTYLISIRSFVDAISVGVNSLTPTVSLSQTTIDGYKADISAARTNINTAITNISAAEEKKRTAESSISLAENELLLKQAGMTAEQIAAQEAAVKQAAAKVTGIRVQLEKMVLRSPIVGLITKQDAKTGEIVGANTPLVSVISTENLEIEANVPEVDIGKVSVGNNVKITLDAFPNESVLGNVSYIDPAETVVDGVVNFKIKIFFAKEDRRFKSGLTANLAIETLRKDNVLIVPQYAVLEKDTGAFVHKEENGTIREIPVIIGIRSKDGRLEIVSGVLEGEKVLNVGIKANGK